MLFTSIEYFLFLPIIVMLSYLMSHKFRWLILLSASYYFYAYWRFDFLLLVIVSTIIDYWAGIKMSKFEQKMKRRKYLYISIFSNIGMLFFFKYLGFFNEQARSLFSLFEINYPIDELDILLPIGISFYTFQTLSYTIDVYRGNRKAERHLGYFALYVSFFPQLIAGPIERSTSLLPQLRKKIKFDWVNISKGSRLIIWGLFKKLIIADYLVLLFKPIMSNPELFSGSYFFVAMLAAAIWIYADFSGYTDIAIGSARLMGIKLMPNFKRPYFSESISELWQRWHISLTSWVNDYFFKPLIRRAKSRWSRYLAIVFIFFIIGFWHKASWNLIAFGILHSIYIISNRITRKTRRRLVNNIFSNKSLLRKYLNIMLTFFFWMYSSALFVSDSIENSFYIMTQIFTETPRVLKFDIPGLITADLVVILVGFTILFFAEAINRKTLENPFDSITNIFIRWPVYFIMIFLLIIFGHQTSNDFFYFQF